jgi:hypothetical protein
VLARIRDESSRSPADLDWKFTETLTPEERLAMSLTAIGPIERAVHTMNTWLKELMVELG